MTNSPPSHLRAVREAAVPQVNIAEAKAHLSSLVQKAAAGEEVVIARDGKPLVRLVPVGSPKVRKLGSSRGTPYTIAGDFDAPLDEFAEYLP